MKITLNNIGKRFNSEWIFRNVSYALELGQCYVILGSNGSGKSTLLQAIAGNLMVSEGDLKYEFFDKRNSSSNSMRISTHTFFEYLSIAAPYLDLYEDYTLLESIDFHFKFKPVCDNLSLYEILKITGLEKSKDKQLKYFSSGMKQRLKLALAILSDVPLLLLDEPCSNLDKEAVLWYQGMIDRYSKDKLVIVCSNQQKKEYVFCEKEILMEDFKK